MQIFAERLKELRTEKGLSQAQLSKKTGISQTAITYCENRQRIPNTQAIVILSRFFGITTDYLLGVQD